MKSGDDGANVAACGGERDTPPGNQTSPPQHPPLLFRVQAPSSCEREQMSRPVPFEVGPLFRHPRASVEARGVQPNVESYVNVPWKLNPMVFSDDSSDYR